MRMPARPIQVRRCAIATGREENNIKAYIGNAVLVRQLDALGERDADEIIAFSRQESLSHEDRARVSIILKNARRNIADKDNGSKAALSAVSQVYGIDAKFGVSKMPDSGYRPGGGAAGGGGGGGASADAGDAGGAGAGSAQPLSAAQLRERALARKKKKKQPPTGGGGGGSQARRDRGGGGRRCDPR
eukprot:COSAG01_NODE_5071_length_4507_cov_1.789927_3_plen_188_part_00